MTESRPALVGRLLARPAPVPWEGGLPWHEPGFSERMLAEHLSQEHDLASRRSEIIDAQVAWLHVAVLGQRPARVLDLGCGAGLHTLRMAALGHSCIGIDFAPAAVAHARSEAVAVGAACEYRLGDVRDTDLGAAEFDLAMMLYGDLDTIPPADAGDLLHRVHSALRPGGKLVVEAHTRSTLETYGRREPTWSDNDAGLMAPVPHLLIEQSFWLEESTTAVVRFWVVTGTDARAITVTTQARDYPSLLAEAGFENAAIHPGYGPTVDPGFNVVTASRPG